MEYAEALRAGTGPVAVDAERASGYRYGQRAYLVQLRRNGSGTGLIDPVPLPDLSVIQDAIADEEWVLHAANQDLPCLAEIGLVPRRIFDTELAARLAGLPRVGLGAVVESLLGFSLQKGHSAADWSTRPLPEEWLVYAALDVEVLVDLRDALAAILEEQGKTEWARQEFEAILAAGPPAPKADPWRRTSGRARAAQPPAAGHAALAVAGPRRAWPAAATSPPAGCCPTRRWSPRSTPTPPNEGGAAGAAGLPRPRQPQAGQHLVRGAHPRPRRPRGASCPCTASPATGRRRSTGGPTATPRRRRGCRPPAPALAEVSEKHSVPVENIVSPDLVRRIMWSPPEPRDAAAVAEALRAGGAREWQIELTVELLTEAAAARLTAAGAAPTTRRVARRAAAWLLGG